MLKSESALPREKRRSLRALRGCRAAHQLLPAVTALTLPANARSSASATSCNYCQTNDLACVGKRRAPVRTAAGALLLAARGTAASRCTGEQKKPLLSSYGTADAQSSQGRGAKRDTRSATRRGQPLQKRWAVHVHRTRNTGFPQEFAGGRGGETSRNEELLHI